LHRSAASGSGPSPSHLTRWNRFIRLPAESIDAGADDWEADILSCLHRLLKLDDRRTATPVLLTEEGAFLHKRFHMSLVNARQSIWRLRVIDVLYDQSERYRRLQTSYMSGMLNSAEEHRAIAAAAIARDKQNATRLLGLHRKKTAEILPDPPSSAAAIAGQRERVATIKR
jgi:GntR family transcriptional regulator, carbon starvation induced regulator